MVLRPYLPLPLTDADPADPDPRPRLGPPEDLAARARRYLEALGRSDHPDAAKDPLYALFQVAVDFRCTATGYRALYFHRDDTPH